MNTDTLTVHEGQNVKRIREILRIKQETLARDLGLSQQAVSQLEQKEVLGDDLLEKVAKVLKVSPEAIRNFDEEKAVNIFSNTFHDHSMASANMNYQPTFNPLDKVVQLYDDKIALYERMLKEKTEMIAKLEQRRAEQP